MKLKSISILPIILSILGSEGVIGVNKDNVENYVSSSPKEVTRFIEDNFPRVVSEYNKENEDNKWMATSIENQFDIIIDDTETQYVGVFLDFDKDNGYAIVGKDYQFMDFSVTGESPYSGIETTSYYYSTVRGYMFLYDGQYVKKEEMDMKKQMTEEMVDCQRCDGQFLNDDESDPGVGKIYDTDKYVKAKYGDGWTKVNDKILPHYDDFGTKMDCLSVYRRNEVSWGNFVSHDAEGSCWFVSSFNILQSMADIVSGKLKTGDPYDDAVNKEAIVKLKTDFSKENMPGYSEKENYDPENDEPDIYYQYYNNRGENKTNKLYDSNGNSKYSYEKNSISYSFPKLYKTVRKYVTSKFKSVYSGHNAIEIASIVNTIGNMYGYSFNARGVCSCSEENSAGLKCINNHLPFIFCTSAWSNGGYGTHAVVGYGYKEYTKEVGWWFFKHIEHKYFYAFVDGWSAETRYFDISAYWGIGGGIVVLNKNWINSYNYHTMGR